MKSKTLIKLNLWLLFTIVVNLVPPLNIVKSQNLILAENLISLNSAEGEKLLMESKARADYIPLTINFTTQNNLAYCGVASIAMTLNALNLPAPEAYEYNTFNKSYPTFTQNNIFNQDTDTIITATQVSRGGMTLEQLGQLLTTHQGFSKSNFTIV